MHFVLETMRKLLYNHPVTKEVFRMTMMSRATAPEADREIDFVQAIDDCSHAFMASYRLWPVFVSYGVHCHQFYEIIVHRRNGGRFIIGRDEYEMKPNAFYVVAPFQLHDIVSAEPLHFYERICIYVTEAMLASSGLGLVPVLDLINSASVNHHNGIELTDEEYEEIAFHTSKIHRKIASDNISPLEEMEDRLHFTLILAVLCRVLEKRIPAAETVHISPLILQVTNFIGTNYMNPISLETIAQSFNVSKYYLSHEFARAMGTSVYQYLLVCRVNAAKQMIISGEAITSVAYRCGFNDYSSFLRSFTRIAGVSPSNFRKRYSFSMDRLNTI